MNIENTMHKAVRDRNPGATPPVLDFREIGDNKLRFLYSSPRKLVPVAVGIMKGVAKYFDEGVNLTVVEGGDANVNEMIVEIVPA